MSSRNSETYFLITTPPDAVRREKDKARELRKTQWWQRRIAKGVCHYCNKNIPSKELTLDHVVPLIRGGKSTRGNVVPACKACNSCKKYLLPIEWEDYLRNISKESVLELTGSNTLRCSEDDQDEGM